MQRLQQCAVCGAAQLLFVLLAQGRPLVAISQESAPVVRDAERPT